MLAAIVLALPLTPATPQIHVDAVKGDDVAGSGAATAPYRTITRGVQDLSIATGDKVLRVRPGVYDKALGETFPISLPAGAELLGAGAQHTLVESDGQGVVLSLADAALVSDVTVQHGAIGVLSQGKCFGLSGDTRYVSRCEVRACGVGIRVEDCFHSDHGVAVVSTVIRDNQIGCQVQSIDWDFQSATLLLYGSTVTENVDALDSLGPGGERYLGIWDSIVWGNGDDSITDWSTIIGLTGNVLGDPQFVGIDANIGSDPLFVAAASGDVHLRATSPAIDHVGPAAPWPPAPYYVGPTGWSWEPTFESVRDFDGGDRVISDVIDPGADEWRAPTLYLWGLPRLGAAVEVRAQASAGDPMLLAYSTSLLPAPILGGVFLAAPFYGLGSLVADGDGLGSIPVQLPAQGPALVGLDVFLQGAILVPVLKPSSVLHMRVLP